MNKSLYKHRDGKCLYYYKTWKNSTKNSGATMVIWDYSSTSYVFSWTNSEDDEDDYGQLIGAACLAQW